MKLSGRARNQFEPPRKFRFASRCLRRTNYFRTRLSQRARCSFAGSGCLVAPSAGRSVSTTRQSRSRFGGSYRYIPVRIRRQPEDAKLRGITSFPSRYVSIRSPKITKPFRNTGKVTSGAPHTSEPRAFRARSEFTLGCHGRHVPRLPRRVPRQVTPKRTPEKCLVGTGVPRGNPTTFAPTREPPQVIATQIWNGHGQPWTSDSGVCSRWTCGNDPRIQRATVGMRT